MKNTTMLIIGSMTNALKAKRHITRAGIKAVIIKVDEDKAKNGCSHGIEIMRYDFYSAVDILRKAGIEYSVYDSR